MVAETFENFEPDEFVKELSDFFEKINISDFELNVSNTGDRETKKYKINLKSDKDKFEKILKEVLNKSEMGGPVFFSINIKEPKIDFDQFTYGIDVYVPDEYKKIFKECFSRTLEFNKI